jgi:hypothetical protein
MNCFTTKVTKVTKDLWGNCNNSRGTGGDSPCLTTLSPKEVLSAAW